VDSGFDDELAADIEFLAETFSRQDCVLLNVFDAFDNEPENRSPVIADRLGLMGFGDFGINVRYPGGGGPSGTVRIRHYHPNNAIVEEFEGSDYGEASNELTNWDLWQRGHCDYCRDASRLQTGDPSTWKRIRMGHYFTSVLRNQI
jgi:hypothetical protein